MADDLGIPVSGDLADARALENAFPQPLRRHMSFLLLESLVMRRTCNMEMTQLWSGKPYPANIYAR